MVINLISSPFFASLSFHQHHKVFFILIFNFPKKITNLLIGWEIIQHFKRIFRSRNLKYFFFSPTKSPLWNLNFNHYIMFEQLFCFLYNWLKITCCHKIKNCAPIIDGKEPQFTGVGETKLNKLFRAPQTNNSSVLIFLLFNF